MKSLACLLFFIGVYHGVSTQFTPVDILSKVGNAPGLKSLSEMVRKNCNEADFKQKMETMQKCYLDFKGKETFCGMIKNHLVTCTQPVVDTLEKCVDSRYHDIPKFIIEVVDSTAEYACKAKGEKIIELLHPCLTSIGYKKASVCFSTFKQKVENIENDTTIKNIKTDLCKSLEKTKACFLKEFKETCHNDVTMAAAVGLYDAVITKPCKHV